MDYLANEIENERFINFMSTHSRCKPRKKWFRKQERKCIQVNFSWDSGIGTAVDVTCSLCKVNENITNYERW